MKFAHIRALMWLQYRSFLHSLGSISSVLGFLWRVLVLFSITVIGGALFLGSIIGGYFMVRLSALAILPVVDGVILFVLVMWGLSLLVELQRGESFDLRKMLFLPVSVKTVFGLNLAIDLTASMLFLVPPSLGLTLGAVVAAGPRMLLIAPLCLAFDFTLGVWVYYIQGLIAMLFANKRRRQTLMAVISIFFVLLAVMPQVAMFAFHGDAVRNAVEMASLLVTMLPFPILELAMLTHALIPLGWLPLGISCLFDGNYAGVTLCLAGLSGLGAIGFRLGYRSTLRFYQGAGGPVAGAIPRQKTNGPIKRLLVERNLPFLAKDTAACTLMSLLNCLRLPQMRLGFVMSLVLPALGLGVLWISGASAWHSSYLALLLPIALPVWQGLNSLGIAFNIFGFDHHGFRALVLSPVPRHRLILGRNLALCILAMTQASAIAVMACLVLPVTPATFATAILGAVQVVFCMTIPGNVISLYLPFRVPTFGSRPNKQAQWRAALVGLVGMMFMPVFFAPAVLAAGIDSAAPFFGYEGPAVLGPVSASAFLLLTLSAYAVSLRPFGGLLQQREKVILETVTRDKE